MCIFPGIEIEKHKSALAYLNKKYLAPAHIRPVAVKNRYIKMKDNELINDSNFKKLSEKLPENSAFDFKEDEISIYDYHSSIYDCHSFIYDQLLSSRIFTVLAASVFVC